MANNIQFYAQMADQTAEAITGSYQAWTAFLTTAARLYKYPYHEQLMIYAQRPEATACAEYDFWNKRMRRYVRRGSKGIALVDPSGERPSLRYVFDVADTGGGDNARRPYLWQLREEHMDTVLRALEARYGVSGRDGLEEQLELVANRLAKEYWEEHQRDILGIVDGSFLEEYDDYNVGASFRSAASVSAAYALLSRCGLEPERYFEHEDFLSVFDWNTPAAVSVLGTAVSEASEQVLRHIEVTIKRYEREKIKEGSQDHEDGRTDLHTERGLSDPGSEAARGAGGGPLGQIREDAEDLPERAPAHPVPAAGAGGAAVPPPAGDRRDRPAEAGRDDAPAGERGGGDGGVEGRRPDALGGPDEQLQGTGGGDHFERAGVQLAEQLGQFSLFPSEREQRQRIEAEGPSAEAPDPFAVFQEKINTELRLGSGNPTPAPPFHRKYLPEILRYEGRAASWAALGKFFTDHPEENTRVGYLRLRFGEDPHQLTALDGTGIGFQGFPDHLRVWEGSALTPAAEARLTWPEVCLLVEQEIAQEQAPPETAAEMPPQEAIPEAPEPPQPSGAVTQAGIDAAIQAWNGSIESKHAVVRYMKEHGREKDTAAWLRQEYGDGLPAFPVTVDGAAADVSWPKVQRRIARLIREDRFYTQAEQDNFDSIDPIAIREELARRGIVNGQMADPEKLDSDPFIRQVMADVERVAHAEEPEDAETTAPAPTVREIYEQYLPIVREKVLADKAYQNACQNSDRENAMLEGAEAIKRAVRTMEDTTFLRLYYDLAEFHNDIHRAVLEDTYTALAATAEQEARPEAVPVVESSKPEVPAGRQPRPLPVPPYGVGDSVYLEGKAYTVTALKHWHVELLDPTLTYPVYRLETRENFERLLREDPQNGHITEFLFTDPERFDQDLREALTSGLLDGQDKDYISQWLRDGEGNTRIAQRLSQQFAGREGTLALSSGHRADYQAVTTGMEVKIIRADDMVLALLSPSWSDIAPVLRGLHNQELDGFTRIPARREYTRLEGTPTYQVGDQVTLPAPDHVISGTIGYIGEQEIRVDTGPFVGTSSISLAPPQAAELTHSAAPPLPTKPDGFAGTPVRHETVQRTQFEKWLRRDARNAGLFRPEAREAAEPEPPQPEAGNFRITDPHLGEGGPKEKFRRNVEAIRTLKQIEAEGRGAAAAEQEVLSRYVGWGGLPDAFDPEKENWAQEYQELRGLLTDTEYAAARASTLTAHYTSPTVIHAIYEALGNFGFQNGNILEPSCGVGNFFGLLPESMAGSQLYGVELDSITGRIAALLYPDANILVRGFEQSHFPDSFFDVAIGNVPFGAYKVNDERYDKLGFHIHNYFFAKALDQVRPGGIVAFVTSRYTMDSKDEAVRRYLAQRAELLGAIRLPNNAFRANAGTEVVSDILFLQKRDHLIDIVPAWVQARETPEGFSINHYFQEHPEMVLGQAASESTQYGHQDYTVRPIEGADLAQQLHEAVGHIQGQITAVELPELGGGDEAASMADSIPADPNVRNYSYTVVDGEVYFRENSIMVKPELNATALARVLGMVELRDCAHRLIDLQMQDADPLAIQGEQRHLNNLYDAFTAKYGHINSRANELAFSEDSAYYLLCSLEVLDDDGNFREKADMFTRRTIQPHRAVTHVDTASEALAVSISERARVDMDYMAQLTGKTEAELASDLRGVIFRLPASEDGKAVYVAADEYLSGNVRQKLAQARRAAEADPVFQDNVEALEQALPKDLDASEIEVRLGATWIDAKYIQQFMYETFRTPNYVKDRIQVHFSDYTAEWTVTHKGAISSDNVAAYDTFGTGRANAYYILENTLNLRDMRIYDTIKEADGTERRVLNQKETTLAQQKQQAIKDAFRDWLWQDPERRHTLVRKYNDLFNSIRPREYDGRHIVFGGMNPEIKLREHQLNAVAHILYGGNTLLAHEVGAGKTFEMVAAAMESKRLGLCRKSLFAVPNHLVEQWASEFLRLYPAANILVTTQRDFETRNRKKFCAKIATGDYDAVIMGHSQFERLPVSWERRERLLHDQIAEIEEGIEELRANSTERVSIKQLERAKKSLRARLEKLADTRRKDDVVTFEQLGVDRLFVDEAHAYKNLFFFTKMRNVAGLSTSDAQKSSDMLLKCRYLDEITGGRGVVFATGTPVSNSMTELYSMQRYLQQATLERQGLNHFDNWASTFGETVTAIELAPEGTGYRARTRFSNFFNLPELMAMFHETADIKTADQLNLPVPEVEYHVEKAEPTGHQKAMVQELSKRAAEIHFGRVDPRQDNMLKVTSDGRKLGLDQRIINPMLPDDPNSKVNMCVNNILRIWREGQADKLTQLVFCDISTPKPKAARRDKTAMAAGDKTGGDLHALTNLLDGVEPDAPFSIYEDIRDKLIAGGIPAQEIAFIHDANTPARKKGLFSKVRQGRARVLMGSTSKMGAGMNVQDRLIAIHDLDCPWRPGDLEQRKGRIVRQGNRNKKVHIYRYVTEGTFDSYLWVRHEVA